MNVLDSITQIKHLINQTASQCGRDPKRILLLAVSKQQSVAAIQKAYDQGIHDFGESYWQEARDKIIQLQPLAVTWHFIGPMQSNKCKEIAIHFSWVHSIDRIKIAQLLNQNRPSSLPPLNVCLQINLTAEQSKSGIAPAQALELAREVSQLEHLKLRGLMTIPPPLKSDAQQRQLFSQLKQLLESLNKELGLNMDTLSMGMSDDIVPAIQAGSTLVRVGRAIFGERRGKST